MTNSLSKLNIYTPYPNSKKVSVLDGSLTIIAGIRDVQINLQLIPKDVLHFLKLSTNLTSIKKFTQYMNYKVSINWVFQDQVIGRRLD